MPYLHPGRDQSHRFCEICAVELPRESDYNRRTCSDKCRQRLHRSKDATP